MESIATPTFPTSPDAMGASESCPICVGRSNATDSPIVPFAISRWYRALDSAAVPNPAYCRIVHGRPVYIEAYTPRVYGNSPGVPNCSAGSHPSSDSGPYTGSISRPDSDSRVISSRLRWLAGGPADASASGARHGL